LVVSILPGIDFVEYAEVWGEPAKGDGSGEWPLSEISVADESPLGEDVFHPEKKDEIF